MPPPLPDVMPVSYRIVKSLDLVHTRWVGKVTFEEALEHNESLRSDPEFHPEMRQLSDATAASSAASGEEIRGLARRSAFGARSRRAIVVSDDDTFAVSRMYEAQATNAGTVRIFRCRTAALEWLDIESTELPEG